MMGSAQVDALPEDDTATAPAEVPAFRLEVAERVAAHRRRRAGQTAGAGRPQPGTPAGRHHRIAAAVADRYAQTPSYRAFLAEEAERAVQQAAAAAELAARNAEAVAVASRELLAELDRWDQPQVFNARQARVTEGGARAKAAEPASAPAPALAVVPPPLGIVAPPVRELSAAGLTVRLYEDAGRTAAPQALRANAQVEPLPDDDEVRALEDEIAFRQSPSFEDFGIHAEPPVPLPANLLAFPRQLVAPRKARPVVAEGPLLDERDPQRSIFEVEADQVSALPALPSGAPEWSSIFLDAHINSAAAEHMEHTTPLLASLLPPVTAPLELRMMAAGVDAGLVLAAFAAFSAVALYTAGSTPALVPAAAVSVGVLALFWVGYQMLFFTLSDHTPGMRYARIGLCTFTDENPSRAAIRRRILAQAVAAAPLGLGLLWMLLDDDGLGWHDRISRMYQRAY